ncbi:MAG: hypothetical protein AVDCRST_MAG48-3100, partial [uncultured Friedmanniella sp.]
MADKLSHQLPVGCDMPPAHRG